VRHPETRYARSGDVSIAYQVHGEGEHDLVHIPGFVSNVELRWESRPIAGFLERLGKLARVIGFDKRGTGLSDRSAGIAQLETRMDDARAVMDAVGSERAALFGTSEGALMTLLFAATYPERVTAAVLYAPARPRMTWAPDYPDAPTRDEWLSRIAAAERAFGTAEHAAGLAEWLAPSLRDDPEFIEGLSRSLRQSISPSALAALYRMNMEIDIRHVLPVVHVPTLLVHRRDDALPISSSRYMAARIPGAELVELPGHDHAFWIDSEPILEAIEEFLGRVWEERAWVDAEPERVLSTVLFTDIVGSTSKAVELGDRAWRELMLEHNTRVRRQLSRFGGREIDTAGDGFFASGFDGPARAIRCACAIVEALSQLDIDVRVGLHTGECELMDGKIGGIAVNIGARVAGHAKPGGSPRFEHCEGPRGRLWDPLCRTGRRRTQGDPREVGALRGRA
jgi:pimeloyl-ACP methyl ester carboxylesterase/class 3 adenylate cyclase